jgi:hypothetical protein
VLALLHRGQRDENPERASRPGSIS